MVKLYSDKPSKLTEALVGFKKIKKNKYYGNDIGLVKHPEDNYSCDCSYRPGLDPVEDACGEACVNRELFIECSEELCPSGDYCQNRRIQKGQTADVDVILVPPKGFGLRALESLKKNQFIIEYVGDVIKKDVFLKRMKEYNKRGLKHFYFMGLQAGEIIDATDRGDIGRFINHSCNPNCFIQKWMVGKFYRIGIFANRDIVSGEELTFDYNAERYGSEAQECFCGETNCRGIIGGTKETVDAVLQNLLNVANLEEPIGNPDNVLSFIGLMLKSVEKYPAMVPGLLHRLELTTDRSTIYRFMKFHGSIMLKTYLYEHQKNDDIISKTLNVIEKIPYKYKNGRVENSHLKEWVSRFVNRTDEIGERCKKLVEKWDALPEYIKPPKYSDLGLEPPEVRRQKEEEQKKREEEEKKKREEEQKQKYNTDTKKYDSTHDYYCRYTESNYAFQNLSQFTYWLNQFHDVVYKRPPPSSLLAPGMKRKKSRNSYNLDNKASRYDYNNSSQRYGHQGNSYNNYNHNSGNDYKGRSRGDDYNSGSNEYKGKGRSDEYSGRDNDYKGKNRNDEYNGRNGSPSVQSSSKYKNERSSRYYHPYRRSSPQPDSSASATTSSSLSLTANKKQDKEEKKEEVPPLAPNWSETVDEYGRVYYYNKYTNKTQWERPVVVNDRKTYDGFSEAEIQATIERAEYYSREEAKKREKEQAAEREKLEKQKQKQKQKKSSYSLTSSSTTSNGILSAPSYADTTVRSLTEPEFRSLLIQMVVDNCSRYKHCMDLDTFKKYAKELSDLVQRKEVRQSAWSTYQIDDTLRSRIKRCSVEFMEKLIVKIRAHEKARAERNKAKQEAVKQGE